MRKLQLANIAFINFDACTSLDDTHMCVPILYMSHMYLCAIYCPYHILGDSMVRNNEFIDPPIS